MTDREEAERADKEHRIRSAAYMIWESEGRVDGYALAHWVKATEMVEAEDAAHRSTAESEPADAKGRIRKG